MKKGQFYNNWAIVLSFLLLIFIIIGSLTGFIKLEKKCELNADCKENEFCYINDNMFHTGRCKENLYWFNTSSIKTNYTNKYYYNDVYCYLDNSRNNKYECKVLKYQNGTNKTLSCVSKSILTMSYSCINLTKENATIEEVII
jgi:hypothetical protein